MQDIEDEVWELRNEVNYQRNELANLKSEMKTSAHVCENQQKDIDRYLSKECAVLRDVIGKQNAKQNSEYNKFNNVTAQI